VSRQKEENPSERRGAPLFQHQKKKMIASLAPPGVKGYLKTDQTIDKKNQGKNYRKREKHALRETRCGGSLNQP